MLPVRENLRTSLEFSVKVWGPRKGAASCSTDCIHSPQRDTKQRGAKWGRCSARTNNSSAYMKPPTQAYRPHTPHPLMHRRTACLLTAHSHCMLAPAPLHTLQARAQAPARQRVLCPGRPGGDAVPAAWAGAGVGCWRRARESLRGSPAPLRSGWAAGREKRSLRAMDPKPGGGEEDDCVDSGAETGG